MVLNGNQLTEYLAELDGKTIAEFLKDRQGKLKAIDKLRLFYVSMYQVKQEV